MYFTYIYEYGSINKKSQSEIPFITIVYTVYTVKVSKLNMFAVIR